MLVNSTDAVSTETRCDRVVSQKTAYVHETGKKDSKGRTVGLYIWTARAQFEPCSENRGIRYIKEPGVYFMLNMQATRDGREFGPCQPYTYYKTVDARQRAISRRLERLAKSLK